VAALLAIFVATFIASSRLLRFVFTDLDLLAYGGLAIACWIGAGGALVPIPGVRMLSWLMIVQQGAALNPFVVATVAALAMVLGQSSYFLASRTASAHMREHHDQQLQEEAEERPIAPPNPPGRRAEMMEHAMQRIETQLRRHSMLTVFVVSALPTPMTTLTTTAAASVGMPYARYVVSALAGFLLLAGLLAGIGQVLLQTVRGLFNL
jgi:membrane protein DedA with SNARE-associated domain